MIIALRQTLVDNVCQSRSLTTIADVETQYIYRESKAVELFEAAIE